MKKIASFIVLSLLLATQAFAKIEEIKSYRDFNLSQLDSQTLVIFDIDNTLIRQEQMIGTHQWGDYMKARAIKNGASVEDAGKLQHQVFGEVQDKLNVVPVEKYVLSMLKYLKDHKIPNFALTARAPVLKSISLEQIKILQHSFKESFPAQINPAALGEHLTDGVIFSGEVPKGELLKRIIENSKVKPKKIVFFDDRRYNLDSIEQSFQGSNIELMSLRYGAADAVVQSFNPIIADLEYSLFKETHLLISDAEAFRLQGNLNAISQIRLDSYISSQGPLASTNHICEAKGTASAKLTIYTCLYEYDGMPASIDFKFNQTPEGGYSFGNW